jgi:ABC-2 type transport system permease protein
VRALIASEWLKIRTTRLLHGSIPATVGLSAVAIVGVVRSADTTEDLLASDGLRGVLAATGTGALVVLVLGILISAGEHRYGTAADTYLTSPHRRRVLLAKLVAASGTAVLIAAVTIVTCLGTAVAFYRLEDVTFPLGRSDVWSAMAGTTIYVAAFAALGVALGTLLRNVTTAIGISLTWFAIVEHTLVSVVPSVGRWLPAAAGQALVRTPSDDLLSPLAGGGVLLAYALVASALAMRIEGDRDA